MIKLITAFDNVLEKISKWGIVAALMIILVMSMFAIVLRWMGQSLMWPEPLVRHLVFLSAFLGGSLATSKNVHIKVDLFTKLVEKSNSKVIQWIHVNLVALFCFVTCVALMKSGWDFFLVEKEFGAPSFLDIHSSILVGIIPFGMGLIALRFLNQLLLGLLGGGQNEHHRL